MKSPIFIIVALTAMFLLSGCIFPGEYWGRHHDHGGDRRDGGHDDGYHSDDRGNH